MLRLMLICGLVVLHYGGFEGSDWRPWDGVREAEWFWAQFVNAFCLFFLLAAVPLLSAISGYLFFDRAALTWQRYRTKIGRRFWSMFVPMVLWNAMLFVAVAAAIAAVPGKQDFIQNIIKFEGFSPLAIGNALFGITEYPINFQFWFIRDLLITILLTPLIYLAARYAAIPAGLALAAIWFFNVDVPVFFRTDVPLFFYIGAMIKLKGWSVEIRAGRAALICLALFTLLAAARALAPYYLAPGSDALFLVEQHGTRLMRLVGVTALWLSAPFLVETAVGRFFAAYSSFSFFLFAAHTPLNRVVKFVLEAVGLANTNLLLIVNFVLTSVITIALAALAAWLLSLVLPRLLVLLSGGRLGRHAG
jgi:surface polysaccharide O-acyltransferase-like enzyme